MPDDFTKFQPILPPEGAPTRAEKFFIEVQPALFPPNQDSNWGLKRKIWTDQVQALIDQQDSIWRERFVATSVDFVDEWEREVGIPVAPATYDLNQRRQAVLSRLRTGPFREPMLRTMIEPFISATFGVSVELTPSGVSLAGGIPLFADAAGDPKQYYRLYFDPQNYAYTLYIRSDVTPDTTTLLRDLQRVTPAGMTITLNNTLSNILDYAKQVRNEQPIAYYRLGNLNDSGGYALTLTDPGGTSTPAVVASPGLLDSHVAASDGAKDFDGTNDYLVSPSMAAYTFPQVSLEARITADTFPATSAKKIIWAVATNYYFGISKSASGVLQWEFSWFIDGVQKVHVWPASIVASATYHVQATHDGHDFEFIVNGISLGEQYDPGIPSTPSGSGAIGSNAAHSGSFWDGKIDELALYNKRLTLPQSITHYHTGNNDWT
jgi:hypothetical protein